MNAERGLVRMSMPYLICTVLAFVPAIVVHEAAHALAAYKLGDRTAARNGRLSINPMRHIDPFGTVILPLLLLSMNMPVFGYAKPVPYNPRNFKDPRRGDALVGLAGPAANLALALLAAVLFWALSLTGGETPMGAAGGAAFYAQHLYLPLLALINLYLLFFNLLPIPPLDGSSLIALLVPESALPRYYLVQRYALPALLIVAVLLPTVVHVNPFGWYLDATAGNVFALLFPQVR